MEWIQRWDNNKLKHAKISISWNSAFRGRLVRHDITLHRNIKLL